LSSSAFKDSGVSLYDRMVWPEGVIEHLLATGERRREVMTYLGETEYVALQPLAIAAARAPRRDQCIYLVPGIMGSQLSLPRAAPLPDNLLWVDPVDFQLGNLMHLKMPGQPIKSCGPVLYSYLPLKLSLEAAGFTVRYFDYDWRLDLAQLGESLATRISTEATKHVQVIGHSMGGLIARSAMDQVEGHRINQLITLGTPHGGSFAPVQALRGVYPLIRRIAQLDPARSAEFLAQEVFSTFPSLYQMLPRANSTIDLRDISAWPKAGPQPNAQLLASSRAFKPAAPNHMRAIVGCGHPTVVKVTRVDDQFHYSISDQGDGTVPARFATIDGVETLYCDVAHGELPRSPRVHDAVLRLLSGERVASEAATKSEPTAEPEAPSDEVIQTDSQLGATLLDKIDWSALDAVARRAFLDSLSASPRPQ
jgi:pimeloyl-ACP methyl ester carboxylesterase